MRTSIVLSAAFLAAVIGGCDQRSTPADRPTIAGSGSAAPTTAPANGGESRLINRPDEIVTRLDSGLTVVVKRYPAAPIVSVRVLVRAGSIYEGDYTACGISHLCEHLLSRAATTRRSEQQSTELLERIGAMCNAYTTFDRTVYHIDAPAEHVATLIDLLADWMTGPVFPADEVVRELGVVQRELETHGQDVARQFSYKSYQLRYQSHPARFPVIGLKPALARLTRDDVLAYYRRMYVPANTVVAVVGDIDPSSALATVKGAFAGFVARPVAPVYVPPEPPVTSPRTLVCPMDVAQVRFSVGVPTVDALDDDMYPLDVMMYVLGVGQSSRLTVELRDRRRLALSISAASFTPSWADGSFLVHGMCLPANWPALREAILAEFRRLIDTPITAEALAQAKRQAVVLHIRSQETAGDLAETLGASQLSLGDAHFDDRYIEKLNAVTAPQVQAAAKKYFDPNRLLTLLVVPRDFVDESQSPRPAVRGVSPTTGPDLSSSPPAARPAGAIEVSPIRKVVLENGLTLLLRRNSAVPLVAIQMQFAGGLLAEAPGQSGVCRMMVLSALRGTKARTGQEVFAAFEKAGGTLGGNSGRHSFSFSASVLADQLDETLPLFAEVVTQPAFRTPDVDRIRQLALAAIARTDEDLELSANRFFLARMFGPFAYGRPVTGQAETVAGLAPADLAAFHRRWVAGRNAVLAIFGDIDLDATEKLARRAFAPAALPPGEAPKDWPAPPAPRDKAERFVQPTKLTEAAEIDIGFAAVTPDHADYYPLVLLDTMISGYHMPGGWLHETLRGRQLVYVVHATNIGWRQAGLFWIYAQCQPDKVRQAIDAINEQLDRARRGEFTEQQLANARGAILATDLMGLATNDNLAAHCALDELLGLGYDRYEKLSRLINGVTMADVVRVARKYLVNPVTTVTTCKPPLAASQ